MKNQCKEWGEGVILSLAAGGVVAVLAVLYAPIVWKLAQQTLFYADVEGLCDLLSTRGTPGGFLDWLGRGCQVTGLGSFAWLTHALAAMGTILLWRCVFRDQQKGLGPILSFPAALLPIFPALLAGTALWLIDDYSAGFRNTFGLWTAMGVYALGRRTRAWIAAAVAVVLFPWFGFYSLLGAMALDIRCWVLVVVPAMTSGLLYHDLCLDSLYLGSSSILDRLRLCSLNAWTVGAFACFFVAAAIDRRAVDPLVRQLAKVGARVAGKLPAVCRRSPSGYVRAGVLAAVGVALVADVWSSRPKPDLRGQMAREHAVVEGRWADVLKVTPLNGNALRMESAYRILALARLGQLPDKLFDEPLWSSQESTDAQEELMDGHELLFAYGMLLPARRYLYETMATKDWMPRHFQVLGDIAFLFDEGALAERNYKQLLRCPYYRDFAKARLAVLHAAKPTLPPDLEIVANQARTINAMLSSNKVEFFDIQQNVEQLIYNHFVNVKNCDGATARFCLACMLLKKKHDTLALNKALLDNMFGGPANVPRVLQQALVVSGKYPADSILPDVYQEAQAFRVDAQRVATGQIDQSLFLARWASTYYFYNEFVK